MTSAVAKHVELFMSLSDFFMSDRGVPCVRTPEGSYLYREDLQAALCEMERRWPQPVVQMEWHEEQAIDSTGVQD